MGGDLGETVHHPPTRKARGRGQDVSEGCGLLPLLAGPSLWPLLLAAGVRFDGGPVC